MRSRRASLFVFLFFVSFVGLSAVASATTMRALSIDDLAHDADLVVRGRVTSVSDVMTGVDGRLVPRSVATVAVAESIVGSAPSEEIRIIEPGTRDRGLILVRAGMTELRRGQEVLLFLRSRGPGYVPVGHAQGAFVVRRDRRSTRATLVRAGDPGWLVGAYATPAIDLDSRPDLESVVSAVRGARGGSR